MLNVGWIMCISDFWNDPCYLKYLGLPLDKRLAFNNHLNQTIDKAHARLQIPYDLNLIFKTIISLILPTILCPIWCSISNSTIIKLHVVQNNKINYPSNVCYFRKFIFQCYRVMRTSRKLVLKSVVLELPT